MLGSISYMVSNPSAFSAALPVLGSYPSDWLGILHVHVHSTKGAESSTKGAVSGMVFCLLSRQSLKWSWAGLLAVSRVLVRLADSDLTYLLSPTCPLLGALPWCPPASPPYLTAPGTQSTCRGRLGGERTRGRGSQIPNKHLLSLFS